MTGRDPFRALGLPPSRDLSDDDIRAAWRRIAATTHPDRGDGGDPAAFAAAAAAYAVLRTRDGRGEALADLLAPGAPASQPGLPRPRQSPAAWLRTTAARIRHGRPAVLALRLLLAATVGAVAVAAVGWQPATIAILTGVATWLVGTSGSDVVPPR
jgi:curved DNA-binding protein CbpA